jgi:hypothetical protein
MRFNDRDSAVRKASAGWLSSYNALAASEGDDTSLHLHTDLSSGRNLQQTRRSILHYADYEVVVTDDSPDDYRLSCGAWVLVPDCNAFWNRPRLSEAVRRDED